MRPRRSIWCWTAVILALVTTGDQCPPVRAGNNLEAEFASPPAAARPWVYWFWKNGNISRAGITADLEAMQRVGIGGVILMEVSLSTPAGPVSFFSSAWRDLFQHAVTEAARLGLQVSVNSAPGWTGSGGAWVPAAQSMQQVVVSDTKVVGPRPFAELLPQPETRHDYYRDIAVLALPTPPVPYRIEDIAEKAFYQRGPISSQPGVRPAFESRSSYEDLPLEQRVPLADVLDLTDKLDGSGRLAWDVPAGSWTILRFGHTSTGQTNRPAPAPGLECDKLDKEALRAHFGHFTAQLLRDAPALPHRALVATHLDSWEVGAQNWTGSFRQEFRARRGYDPVPYLPIMTGRVLDSLEISERFLWDLRQTVSELIIENHGQEMQNLAQQHGLWLSIEPYDMTPCDDMMLGATADVPMCEFWSSTFDTRYSVKEATSIAHVYGKPVVAAEAFTSTEDWLFHPATIKSLGDWAYSEGVNRFVIHRYVHQPFPQIRPGLSLGPHGLHYERTQTWWELTTPWHEYLARCQHLLQQGQPVADVLYLSPEGAPNVFQRPEPELAGFKYDACTTAALLQFVTVRDGRLAVPSGASYRLLVLPDATTMTPPLVQKIQQLVTDGAQVVGQPPEKSPSLQDYPDCDQEVRRIAEQLWGTDHGPEAATTRPVGRGAIHWGGPLTVPRAPVAVAPPLDGALWIWGGPGEPALAAPVGKRYFRRTLTIDETAPLRSASLYITADNAFELFVNGQPAGRGDAFTRLYEFNITQLLQSGANTLAVVAINGGNAPNPAGLLVCLEMTHHDGSRKLVHSDTQWSTAEQLREGWLTGDLEQAVWSPAVPLGPFGTAPWGKPRHILPRPKVYPSSPAIADLLSRLQVASDFEADTPLRFAHRISGNIDLYFVSNSDRAAREAQCTFRCAGRVPELWHPENGQIRDLTAFEHLGDGRTRLQLHFDAEESYFVVFRKPTTAQSPDRKHDDFPELHPELTVSGPWEVAFDPRNGGPADPVILPELVDWSLRPEEAIRYYSGTATYRSTFQLPAKPPAPVRRVLDLGRVHEIAQVRLNGQNCGIAWRNPFRVDVSDAIREGANHLEIAVTNLWLNRMIGDEHLPLDCELRNGTSIARWPDWLLQGKPSPAGRVTFSSWRSWTKDSPLLESGLLGPVTLQAEQLPDD
jgi:hypothetical protein